MKSISELALADNFCHAGTRARGRRGQAMECFTATASHRPESMLITAFYDLSVSQVNAGQGERKRGLADMMWLEVLWDDGGTNEERTGNEL